MFHLYRTELESTASQFETYVFDHIKEKVVPYKRRVPFYVELLQTIAMLLSWIVIWIVVILVLFTKW